MKNKIEIVTLSEYMELSANGLKPVFLSFNKSTNKYCVTYK